jgi:heavy metal efflux system protein
VIDRIIDFSLRQRVFVLLAALGLLAAGLWSASRLPIDAVPDITNIQVQINTKSRDLLPRKSKSWSRIRWRWRCSAFQG